MKFYFIILFLFLGVCLTTQANNSIRILPDSTGQFAKFEISRVKKTNFKVSMTNEKGLVVFNTIQTVDAEPKIISIPWSTFSDGIYYVRLISKKEEIKLMFWKKSNPIVDIKK